jgi:hypothetical protein
MYGCHTLKLSIVYVYVYRRLTNLSLKSGSSLILNKLTSPTIIPGDDEPIPRNRIGSIAKPYVNDAPTLPPTAQLHTHSNKAQQRTLVVLEYSDALGFRANNYSKTVRTDYMLNKQHATVRKQHFECLTTA